MRYGILNVLMSLSICTLPLGCGGHFEHSNGGGDTPSSIAEEQGHNHAVLGPHGGHLIVLGDEEYHAELAHDEATHTVTVYLLDGNAEQAASVEAAEITLQFFRDGQFVDYTVQPSEEKGKFSLVDEDLCDFLGHSEKVNGRIRATIADREYVGILEHAAHEHEGHEAHDHEAEEPDHDHNEPGQGIENVDHDH